jgi:hypothetical protein
MRRWKPVSSARIWVVVALLLAALIAAVLLIGQLATALVGAPAQWPIDQALFLCFLGAVVSMGVAGSLLYRLGSALTLAYGVDRNGAYIFWLGNRAVIPLAQIETVEIGVRLPAHALDLVRNLGYYHGQRTLPNGRILHCFTTLPLDQALVLYTAQAAYAISPVDADTFVQELEQRRRIGAIQPLSEGLETGRFIFYPFWRDPIVRVALGLTFLLNLITLGWLMSIYPGLPELLAIRTDAVGEAVIREPRHQVLFLPLAACVLSLMNIGLGLTIYAREPIGARFLQIASIVVQVLFAVAVISILRQS